MILYRVMSKDELAAYLKGKSIKPPKNSDVALSRNSWKRPRVCFFGTANNCAHWQPMCHGLVIVKFEVADTVAKIERGWGRYPDIARLTQTAQGVFGGTILADINDIITNPKIVYVKEYAVAAYSKRSAYFKDWALDWGADYISFEREGLVPRLAGYDDLLEEEP